MSSRSSSRHFNLSLYQRAPVYGQTRSAPYEQGKDYLPPGQHVRILQDLFVLAMETAVETKLASFSP